MRTTMLLLTLTVLSGGAPSGTSSEKPDRPSSVRLDKERKALPEAIARGRRTDLRHQRLGDFNLPEPGRAFA